MNVSFCRICLYPFALVPHGVQGQAIATLVSNQRAQITGELMFMTGALIFMTGAFIFMTVAHMFSMAESVNLSGIGSPPSCR